MRTATFMRSAGPVAGEGDGDVGVGVGVGVGDDDELALEPPQCEIARITSSQHVPTTE